MKSTRTRVRPAVPAHATFTFVSIPVRILLVLDTSTAWLRGALMGFAEVANQHDWRVLRYDSMSDLEWLITLWDPRVVVLPPWYYRVLPPSARGRALISVNDDRTSEGLASVCLDEERIADLAASHLLTTGLTNFTTFRFDVSAFAIARERSFADAIARSGRRLVQGWWPDGDVHRQGENAPELVHWLKELPKPCGIFACTDSWARVVARYCQAAEIRIPEQLALIGVDNDVTECEFPSPPLSSVAIPWRLVGQRAAELVSRALAGNLAPSERVIVEPLDVVVRRSSAVLAVADPLVRETIEWIEAHADRRLTVPAVAKAVATPRQTLERRFHAVLGRTVLQEIHRAHVDLAKGLLSTTNLDLSSVARSSGFTNAALLNGAFRRELGMPPGTYRRQIQNLHHDED